MTRESLKTAVVGAGYVGVATAVGLAEQDRDIVLVERDPDRLAALADGRIPFHEPGLPEAYAAQHAARRIAQALAGLAGRRIALLGLAFKADTDDVRSSPALRLAARLLAEGADLRPHDPAAGDNARRLLPDLVVVPTVEEALRDAASTSSSTRCARLPRSRPPARCSPRSRTT